MTTLAVEMAASRLLAPYFGASLLVWANLIGLILIYLTAGYYLGGRVADRFPRHEVLYQITAWAGFLIGLVPFLARPILRLALQGFATLSMGLFLGSFAGVVALFAVPISLLGTVSPFAIRLAVRDVTSSGNVAGSLYALSTLGSIIGTFLPVLVLIPSIGTRSTFLLFSLLLLATSLVGLARVNRRMALSYAPLLFIIVGLGAFLRDGSIKPIPGLVHEAESSYNYIQVIQRDDDVYLALNEGQALHSWYNSSAILADGIWDYFLLAPYFAPHTSRDDVRSLAVIGLAGGTVARQYTAVYGPIPIDGVEIDPQIVEAGRRYFGMNQSNLEAVVQDGRYWLQTVDRRYDVIGIDAYQQPYVPFHLTTVEFFQEVRDHLTENGVAVINAARTPTDFRLVDALANTMARVFPSVYVIDVPAVFNSLIVGTVRPSQITDYADNVSRLEDPLLVTVAERAAGHVRAHRPWRSDGHRGEGLVFTDDRAPVEQLVDQIILGYVLGIE